MLDDYGFEIYEENPFPLAYFITLRTFGTWLHGDGRGSVGRKRNVYGRREIAPNDGLEETMQWRAKQDAVVLGIAERKLVEEAIVEVCERRRYLLHAVNARTNHVHAVVSAQKPPERIADSFKAYSTRKLGEAGFGSERVWSRGEAVHIYGNLKMSNERLNMYCTVKVTSRLNLKNRST